MNDRALQGLVSPLKHFPDLVRCSPAVLADTSDGINGQSRRTSYYSGLKPQQRLGSETPAGYYGNRMSMGRPDRTYVDSNGGNYNQAGYGRRVNHRANSDPMLYGTNNQSVYPTQGYHQSHDTVASASGNESHNTDPWVSTCLSYSTPGLS